MWNLSTSVPRVSPSIPSVEQASTFYRAIHEKTELLPVSLAKWLMETGSFGGNSNIRQRTSRKRGCCTVNNRQCLTFLLIDPATLISQSITVEKSFESSENCQAFKADTWEVSGWIIALLFKSTLVKAHVFGWQRATFGHIVMLSHDHFRHSCCWSELSAASVWEEEWYRICLTDNS